MTAEKIFRITRKGCPGGARYTTKTKDAGRAIQEAYFAFSQAFPSLNLWVTDLEVREATNDEVLEYLNTAKDEGMFSRIAKLTGTRPESEEEAERVIAQYMSPEGVPA